MSEANASPARSILGYLGWHDMAHDEPAPAGLIYAFMAEQHRMPPDGVKRLLGELRDAGQISRVFPLQAKITEPSWALIDRSSGDNLG